MKVYSVLLFFFLCSSQLLNAQADKKVAEEYFKKKNYFLAMAEYHKLIKLERDDPDFNYKLGLCYLKTNINKKKSLKYLERTKESGKFDKEFNYYLGISYAINYNFDKAIEALDAYLLSPGKYESDANKRKGDCEYAKILMKTPAEVSFENMGEAINSDAADYYPFVSGDERLLSYTSRRKGKGKVEFDGYYPSDVYLATYNGSTFSKGMMMKSYMSAYNEQSTGLSQDGNTMFFYSDNNPKGELFLLSREGSKFGKKSKIKEIDAEGFLESSVCLSNEGNAMIFASNNNKGYGSKEDGLPPPDTKGGLDLWMMRKLPFGDNNWAVPQPMTAINTPGDEDFASFAPNGTTIYFASNGLPGMGGWDLYSTEWNPEDNTFSEPKNLGYPLNTPDDEKSISFADDGKHAYISANREDSYGDLDIYRITYELVEVKPALFGIKLASGDPDNPFVDAELFSILNENGELIGEYAPNPNSHEYTVILPPGQYKIEIEAETLGYQNYSGNLKVHDFMNQMGKVDKIIHLKKQP